MGYPPSLLNPGEKVVQDLRPHPMYFFEPAITIGIALVALILFTVWLDDDTLQNTLQWLCGAAVLVALVWLGLRYWRWVNINFVITTDRVIYRSGIFAKTGIQIPLERINNVMFHQRFIERLFDAGDLVIESAGESGRQVFSDVRDPDGVQKAINEEMNAAEARGHLAAGAAAAAGLAGAGVGHHVAAELERLEGLLQRGSITQAEFDAQKAKLLG